MKKVFAIAGIAFIAAAGFTSCKKEYQCTCTDATTLTVSTETHKGSDHEDACNNGTTLIPPKACVPLVE